MGDLRASSVLPICAARKRPRPSGEPGIGGPRRPGTRKAGALAVPGPAIAFPRAAHLVSTCGIASCGTSPFGPRLTGFTRADRTWRLRRRPGKSRQTTDSVRALPETPAGPRRPSAEGHGPSGTPGPQIPHQPPRTLTLQSQQPRSLALLTPRPLIRPLDSPIVVTTSTKPSATLPIAVGRRRAGGSVPVAVRLATPDMPGRTRAERVIHATGASRAPGVSSKRMPTRPTGNLDTGSQ